MNSAVTPNCTLGSPQRKLNFRQQSVKASWRHQNAFSANSEGQAWITKTLHQLHSSTSSRATFVSPVRQSPLCSICRIPLGSPYYSACGGSRSSLRKHIRPGSRCYSLAAATQTSKGGGGSANGNGSNGGGGGGDGSGNPFGSNDQHNQSPLTDTQRVKGLEDVLLLDVQG